MNDNKPAISADKPVIAAGRYRHYKGPEYQVVDVVRHSETEEWMVLYYPLYGELQLWVRPFEMFVSTVTTPEGAEEKRFTLIEPD